MTTDKLLPCPFCQGYVSIESEVREPDRSGYIMTTVNLKHDCHQGFVFSYGRNHYLWCTKESEFNLSENSLLVDRVIQSITSSWNTRASSIDDQRLEHYKRENAALRKEIEIYKSANKDELQ